MEIEGYKLIDVEEAYTLGVLGVPIYYKYKSSSILRESSYWFDAQYETYKTAAQNSTLYVRASSSSSGDS